ECDNDLFSALTFQGGDAWRKQLLADLTNPASRDLVAMMDDDELVATMTDLGGHCLESVLEAFQGVDTDQPVCFIFYTIKGRGLPLAGHKDNHAGLMTPDQMQAFKSANHIADGQEWSKTAGLNRSAEELDRLLARVPFNAKGRRRLQAPAIEIGTLPLPAIRGEMSTQQGFG